MPDGIIPDERTFGRIENALLLTERFLPFEIDRKRDDAERLQPRVSLYNASGETIPAFGCCAVTGLHERAGGKLYFKAEKPSTTFRRQYLPNGPRDIAAGEYFSVPERRHYRWLYNTGTPAIDEGFGPTPGAWYLTKNYPAVTEAVGVYDATAKVIWGTVHTIDTVIGKLAPLPLTAGSFATIAIWGGAPGFEAAISGYTLVGRDWLLAGDMLAANTKVVVTFINGVPYVTQASCAE